MRKLLFTTSLVAIAASSVPAMAQDAASQGETTLAPILVVTPLRRESALAGATASVTIIDQETIEKAPTNDVAQLLKSYAGVSVNAYGGLGSSSGVQLRGMSSTQTLILVNGVRTASATLGSSTLANIPLESIERIEIVKGPRSAAYGADAHRPASSTSSPSRAGHARRARPSAAASPLVSPIRGAASPRLMCTGRRMT